MRADRLLSILFLLQAHRRLTARDLAQRLEVSERTIYRDMEALSMAGIPVYTERGMGGGCVLLEEYRASMTGLNEQEMRSLFFMSSSSLLSDLGLSKTSEIALLKLLSALPQAARRSTQEARHRIHIDAAGWRNQPEAVPCLQILQDAIWGEKKVSISYQRRDRTLAERLVDPLGLVAKASTWYLVAVAEDEIRAYRVSRIQSVAMTDLSSVRPENFDLAAYWTQSCEQFRSSLPRYPVTLRVAPEFLPTLSDMFGEQAISVDTDGWFRVQLTFETRDTACGRIFGFGPLVEVVAPQELRNLMLERAASLIALYTKSQEPVGI